MGSVFEKLSYLKDTKSAIADAIEECNVTVPENSTFFSFGNLIRQIQGQFSKYHNVKQPEYKASTTNPGVSVSPVNTSADTFDVDDGTVRKTPSIKVTSNDLDTIVASDPTTWGASVSDVQLQGDGAATDEPVDGFANVVVKVGLEADYNGGKFTVKFWPAGSSHTAGQELYICEDVPYGGQANYGGTIPTAPSGKVFAGWSPSIMSVAANLDVEPVFTDEATGSGEIQDDWETICANGGANYAIGQWKWMGMDDYLPNVQYDYGPRSSSDKTIVKRDYTTSPIPKSRFKMVKVATGEDGTTSTWVSHPTTLFPASGSSYGVLWRGYHISGRTSSTVNTESSSYIKMYPDYADLKNVDPSVQFKSYNCQWYNSYVRDFLNTKFLSVLPEPIRNSIKPVTKYTCGFIPPYNDNPGYRSGDNYDSEENYDINPVLSDMETVDAIWLLSLREHNMINASGVSIIESKGPMYDTMFTTQRYHNDFANVNGCVRGLLNKRTSSGQEQVSTSYQLNKTLSFQFGFCLIPTPTAQSSNNQESGGNDNGSSEQGQETQGN